MFCFAKSKNSHISNKIKALQVCLLKFFTLLIKNINFLYFKLLDFVNNIFYYAFGLVKSGLICFIRKYDISASNTINEIYMALVLKMCASNCIFVSLL